MKNKEILQELYRILGIYNKFNKSFEQELYDFKVMLEKEEYGDYEQLSFLTEIPEIEIEIDNNNPFIELFGALFGGMIKEEITNCSNCNHCECQVEEPEEEIEILDIDEEITIEEPSIKETSLSELSVDEKSGNVICKQTEFGDDYVDISISDDNIEVSIMVAGLDANNHSDIKKMIDKVYGDALRAIQEIK